MSKKDQKPGERLKLNPSKRRFTMKAVKLLIMAIFMIAFFSQAFTGKAYALSLRLSDGINTITINDNDLLGIGTIDPTGGTISDSVPALGAVGYSGSIGSFIVNVTTGISYPLLGDPTQGNIDLNSISVTGGSLGATLTLELTDVGFLTTGGPVQFTTDIGGTTDGIVTLKSYVDSSNTAFGTVTLLSDLGSFSPSVIGGSSMVTLAPGGSPYSMTLLATITHSDGGQATSFDAEITVPEPASLLLLGSGFLGLGLFGLKKKHPSDV